MPPKTSQPRTHIAPSIAEVPNISLVSLAKNKLLLVAGLGATVFTGGLVARVQESNAGLIQSPIVQKLETPDLHSEIFGFSEYASDLFPTKNQAQISSKINDQAKIAKWSKDCPVTVIVNPSHPRQKQDHRINKKVGRLDVIRGKLNKYAFTRKLVGVKVCGFSGVVPGYAKDDGTIVYGRQIALKSKKISKKKYVAIDPKINGKSLSEVTVFARQPNK